MHEAPQRTSRSVGAALAPAEVDVRCANCGAEITGGEAFCTGCGSAVRAGAFSADTRGKRQIRALPAGLAVGLVVVIALGAFEFVQARHEHSRAVKARHELAQTRVTLAATRTSLARTESLSKRQGAILALTSLVLKKVDPLLTDADQLRQLTGNIQTARDTFARDSGQMTTDLIFLENYEANPQNYPSTDQYSLIAQVNSELQTVNAEYANLTTNDASFSAASTRFGNHADAFTAQVRLLQHQLQALGK
jgi:hypothetical protein